MTEHLERTLPYGHIRALRLQSGAMPAPRLVFDGAAVTPDVEKLFVARGVGRFDSAVPRPSAEARQPRARTHPPRHAPSVRIGCDVHPVLDLAESIELFGDEYLARVFTALEREQCAGPDEVERLAGRLAAKEAVRKVLDVASTAVIPWHSIEVLTGRNGVPFVTLSGRLAELMELDGIARIDISLSHDAGMAMAVAAAMPVERH